MEDAEKDNDEVKRTKSRSPSPGVKSTAVVKYTAFQSPVGYSRLQCNTDLNLPPTNWGAAIDSYGLRQILTQGTGLSSFRMAHMFPDCVGEVDVISGAECIKKLLKLPYQPTGTVSMMVHRVENTLLLDDFDVYDYLMKSEWSWLKDFFYENILKFMSEQEKMKLMLSPAPSSALQLTHKFLSHSVTQNQVAELPKTQPLPAISTSMSIAGPFLPEPETKEQPEELPTEHLYNRNVLWTFEDIHMLIGSDLPIFGDKDRPCVSLRLRDAREPINVLTGIDYWLDNLMCNVPEVLMCYHLDGIVQKYEPMKTEDLPHMEHSKFSPKVIRNVAQNILSFLKSNATKSGHTYWLFKGPHDDVVKLYDLTSLCPDSLDNPFTTPVAMLLYRVARNMRFTNRLKHVKQLLEHVIKLLKVERYPHIVASSHYMLADLYVPATTNPANPNFNDENTDPDDDKEFSDYPDPNPDENVCDQSENVDKTGENVDKTGENVDKTGENEDKTEDNVDKTGENVDKTGENVDKTGENVDKTGENVDKSGENVDKTGENVDKTGQNVDITGENVDKTGENEDKTGENVDKIGENEDKTAENVDKTAENEEKTADNVDKTGENVDKTTEDVDKTGENEDLNGSESEDNDEKSLAVQIRGLALKEIGDKVRDNTGDPKRSRPDSESMGKTLPDRCGKALHHALQGLLALHNVTMDKSKEEERERMRQQIINEEQHPKMANPYEPIKMSYEPISQTTSNSKENTSRSRRRKRERKTPERKCSYLKESNSNIDKNAIQVLKDKKAYPTWHELGRDDNFAWKLHLKTLLYENICLTYATLAEYSYVECHYGFSLKYIDMTSKCQKLLCNMIIKSNVVDASCLIGRVGDNYFQLSQAWPCLEKYKQQFIKNHDIDTKIRLEIENDLLEEVKNVTSDEFDLDISFPTSQISAMLSSREMYSRAMSAARGRRSELLRRRASVTNDLGQRYMTDAQNKYEEYLTELEQQGSNAELFFKEYLEMAQKALEYLDEATDIFKQVNDLPNLVLLHCNKAKYLRLRALGDRSPFSEERLRLYNEAEELYHSALKMLGPREACGVASVWETVEWELSCHVFTKAAMLQDSPEPYPIASIAEALKNALKLCPLSPGRRQHMYQFRAAMVYRRIGLLYHNQFRVIQEEGPRRRSLLNTIRSNYEQAANLFAGLEEATMFLTVQMEHVGLMELQAAVSSNLKLKSLQSAAQLLRQCHSIMKVLKEKDAEEQKEQVRLENREMLNEFGLLSVYESRLHHILKSIIQYCRGKSNKDYDKIADLYKKLYCASLKIKKDNDFRKYAASISDVLSSMDEISKEFE